MVLETTFAASDTVVISVVVTVTVSAHFSATVGATISTVWGIPVVSVGLLPLMATKVVTVLVYVDPPVEIDSMLLAGGAAIFAPVIVVVPVKTVLAIQSPGTVIVMVTATVVVGVTVSYI
jgi:hypothetical protein